MSTFKYSLARVIITINEDDVSLKKLFLTRIGMKPDVFHDMLIGIDL